MPLVCLEDFSDYGKQEKKCKDLISQPWEILSGKWAKRRTGENTTKFVPHYKFSGGKSQQSCEQRNKACGFLLSKI